MTLSPGARLGPVRDPSPSAPAAWVRSTRPATRGWTARSPSRSCPPRARRPRPPAPVRARGPAHRRAQPPAHLHAVRRRRARRHATYLVMEYVDGRDARERLEQGPAAAGRGARTSRMQIADALAAAHRQGIVHRDLKPANVMLTRSRRVGRSSCSTSAWRSSAGPAPGVGASSRSPTRAVTSPGAVIGTVPYMAPEQLEGKEVDARSRHLRVRLRALRDADRAAGVRRRQQASCHLRDHDAGAAADPRVAAITRPRSSWWSDGASTRTRPAVLDGARPGAGARGRV